MHRRKFIKNFAAFATGTFTAPLTAYNIFGQQPANKKLNEKFIYGVAASAFQTEGAWNTHGKGESIWDRFVHAQRKFKNEINSDTACNFYHLYNKDISLIHTLGFRNFRFSLSWPRIIPNGIGNINSKGVDFYHRVIDCCLENNITPWITLYHWDLPQKLEDKGGWTNRDIVSWFTNYVDECTKNYGDKVKKWIVLNEPMSFTGLGYALGYHAPQKRGVNNFLPAVHHAALCQAEGGRVIRLNVKNAYVGTTFSTAYVSPANQKERHKVAANRLDAMLNRLFIEPVLGLGYPFDTVKELHQIEKYMLTGDSEKLHFGFDFIGVQYYFRIVAKHSLLVPLVKARQIPAKHRNVETNEMELEVYPEGLFHILTKFAAYKNLPPLIVTENGVCYPDKLSDEKVIDTGRISFFENHLKQIQKAKNSGCRVDGYFVWSATDNFEWAEGFEPRFGLIYIDFNTQNRYIKNSGYWWQKFLNEQSG